MFVYKVESSLEYLFSAHCFSLRLLVWGPYWQSNLVQRRFHRAYFFSRPVVCSCSGQFIHRFGPCVMNPDWWILPSERTRLVRGKLPPGVDRAALAPRENSAHRTSLERSVSAKTAEEMGQEWVDTRAAAWSQVDTRMLRLFQGHLFIPHCLFLEDPLGERQVGETPVPSRGD